MQEVSNKMSIIQIIQEGIVKGVKELYDHDITADKVNIGVTRKEFEGDYTIVVFPYTKVAKKGPEQIGKDLGEYIQTALDDIVGYNVIKGFLNLEVSDSYWVNFLNDIADQNDYGQLPKNGKKVMVEFSSPNTTKPLHLGHIRNILLGWSCSQILEAAGYEVIKTQIVNDRGIAVCKTMLTWSQFANGATPESEGAKGDHFVGKYYVRFATEMKAEYSSWQQTDIAKGVYEEKKKDGQTEEQFFKAYKDDYFNEYSTLGKAAKELLLKWEANDEDTRALWEKMNNWVYEGFEKTYEKLGVDFDKLYYESSTYLLGKDIIQKGIEKKVFQQSGKRVFADLEDVKLGTKTVLKSDGTSTYVSQDIGTARERYNDYGMEKVLYVVGDEQINHFQVLFEILKRLEEPYAAGLHHLSYGMVDLPTGRMKSREGTVVDADELIAEVINEAKAGTAERGDIGDFDTAEQEDIIKKIGLAALKYFIIKVNPQKRMVFDPKESVDLQGNTGPYIQNAYVRIQSVLKKAAALDLTCDASGYGNLENLEKDIIQQLYGFTSVIENAAKDYDPSLVASYCYDLAKSYHKFWHDLRILTAETEAAKAFRLQLSKSVGQVLKSGMKLLGIEMPPRM